jgi:hypothetical protein
MIQNALVRPANGSRIAGACYTTVLKTCLKNPNLFALWAWSNWPYWPDVFSSREISLFRLLTVGRGFLVPIEVCSDQVFEKDAESPCSTIVHLVNFLSNHLFRFGR